MVKIEKFWNRFLQAKNLPVNTKYSDVYSFDVTQKNSDKLLKLVKENKKTATTSLYVESEFSTQVGEYNILTTFKGTPKAIVKITDVKIMAFKDMTFELAKLEGEDKVFDTWKKTHIDFLKIDAKNYNIQFNDNTKIVFEIFELVYKE
ncbi:MAG: ASCH domain-containing protein [Clostridia bacterium]|nr:ASCH domain-containing protein [Clostridia bacterium]